MNYKSENKTIDSHSFYFKIKPAVDARAYDRIAMNIIGGNGYVEDATVLVEKA